MLKMQTEYYIFIVDPSPLYKPTNKPQNLSPASMMPSRLNTTLQQFLIVDYCTIASQRVRPRTPLTPERGAKEYKWARIGM
jgi:hypothetical protein